MRASVRKILRYRRGGSVDVHDFDPGQLDEEFIKKHFEDVFLKEK